MEEGLKGKKQNLKLPVNNLGEGVKNGGISRRAYYS